MIPPGYPEIPVRWKLGLAPWFALAVVAVGILQDHGVIDLSADAPKTHQHKTRERGAPPPAAVPGNCAPLPPSTIRAYARRAGFTPDQGRTVVAVALAESGGRPCAHNPVPPDDSYCLMQVNMLGPLGPARRDRYHLARNADLYDPATCMRVAYGISAGGTDWTPWTTYTRGTYLQFL